MQSPVEPAPTSSPVSDPQPTTTARWGKREWLSVAALVGAILVTYSPVVDCDFVNYDDEEYVRENPHLRLGFTWEGFKWSLRSIHASNWHPLVWWSLLLDYDLYELNPVGYHVTNVLWHVGSTLLLFAALRRMTGAVWCSALVAALFALHPLNVQPVAWISERKGITSTFFWMLTLWTYARYVEQPTLGRYAMVALSLGVGLMGKQMLVTMPCVLLVLDFWPLQRPARGSSLRWLVVEKMPLLALAVGGCILTTVAQGSAGSVTSLGSISMQARIKNGLVTYLIYLGQAIFPLNLAAFYRHPGDAMPLWQPAAATLILLVVTAIFLRHYRLYPYLTIGWFWYLGTLVPVLGLVQLGFQAHADRYTYVPMVGIFIAVVWTMAATVPWRPATAAAGIALVASMIVTWQEVHYWHDSITLWERANAVTGGTSIAYNNLGLALKKSDKKAAARAFARAIELDPELSQPYFNLGQVCFELGDVAEAKRRFLQALRIHPGFEHAHFYLGRILLDEGQADAAAQRFLETIRLSEERQDHMPADLAEAYNQLGLCRFRQKRFDEAGVLFRKSIVLDSNPGAHVNLGTVLVEQQDLQGAAAEFQEALKIDPETGAAHLNLGLLAQRQGDLQAAARHFERAVACQPNNLDAALSLGSVLLQQGKIAAAVAQFEALAQRAPAHPGAHLNLGVAYAQQGRTSDAIASWREAVTRAHAAGQEQLAREIENRLRAYSASPR